MRVVGKSVDLNFSDEKVEGKPRGFEDSWGWWLLLKEGAIFLRETS